MNPLSQSTVASLLEAVNQIRDFRSLDTFLEYFQGAVSHLFPGCHFFLLKVDEKGKLVSTDGVGLSLELLKLGRLAWRQGGFRKPRTRDEGKSLVLPVRGPDGELLGAFAFVNARSLEKIERSEVLPVLMNIGALAFCRAHEELERRLLKSEMGYAWQVVRSLLPDSSIKAGGFSFAGVLIPAKDVGGDFYDFFPIGEGKYGFVLADATGKGTGPCLQVATCRAYFRALSVSGSESLARVAQIMNNLIAEDTDVGEFITACFGWIDTQTRAVEYVNAGQGTGFVKTPSGLRGLGDSDPPLGVLADLSFRTHWTNLQKGGLLAVFTDGWTERWVAQREEFGEVRLREALESSQGLSAKETLRQVYQRYEAACYPFPQADDVTALVIQQEIKTG